VIPLFKQQAQSGEVTITDNAMTRFWVTLGDAVRFVIASLERMQGGEIYVPRIPSMRVSDIAQALAPGASQRLIGIRPGEKIHEVLITEDESRHAVSFDDYFAIYPSFKYWDAAYARGAELPPGFRYSSDQHDIWLSPEEICEMAEPLEVEPSR
jgi:FlaA1/EpsC-like NDP-sugar epimerase